MITQAATGGKRNGTLMTRIGRIYADKKTE
jgi:hypothetical protein